MPVDVANVVADKYLEYAMILDKSYTMVAILDMFESFVWTDRYGKAGDFTIVVPILEHYLPYIRINYYLSIRESDRLMVIENVELITDPENGDKLKVSGRSLESILDRRIVYQKYEFGGTAQSVVSSAITMNAISPSDPKRKIPNLRFQTSEDSNVNKTVDSMKVFGENVYSLSEAVCSAYNIGMKMLPEGAGGFVFSLYSGVDRSWNQTDRIPVVFSHSYENLLESNYLQSEILYASNALVRGDEDEVTMEVMRRTERTELARREIFIDTDLQPETQEYTEYVLKTDENGEPILDDDGNYQYNEVTKTIKIYDLAYYNRMLMEAKVEMAKHTVTEAFDGEIDSYHQFIYGKDYDLGDIVQVQDRYGYEGRCRVTEIMMTRDAGGPKLIPTFIMVDDEGNEVTVNQ